MSESGDRNEEAQPDETMDALGLSVEDMMEKISTMQEDEAIAILNAYLEIAVEEMATLPGGWGREQALSIRAFTMGISALNFVRDLRSLKSSLPQSDIEA